MHRHRQPFNTWRKEILLRKTSKIGPGPRRKGPRRKGPRRKNLSPVAWTLGALPHFDHFRISIGVRLPKRGANGQSSPKKNLPPGTNCHAKKIFDELAPITDNTNPPNRIREDSLKNRRLRRNPSPMTCHDGGRSLPSFRASHSFVMGLSQSIRLIAHSPHCVFAAFPGSARIAVRWNRR